MSEDIHQIYALSYCICTDFFSIVKSKTNFEWKSTGKILHLHVQAMGM